jgi:hypothetical protein
MFLVDQCVSTRATTGATANSAASPSRGSIGRGSVIAGESSSDAGEARLLVGARGARARSYPPTVVPGRQTGSHASSGSVRPAPPAIGTSRSLQPRPRLNAICVPSGVKRGGR